VILRVLKIYLEDIREVLNDKDGTLESLS